MKRALVAEKKQADAKENKMQLCGKDSFPSFGKCFAVLKYIQNYIGDIDDGRSYKYFL